MKKAILISVVIMMIFGYVVTNSQTSSQNDYKYDKLGRLVFVQTTANGNVRETTYTYDENGNRTGITIKGVPILTTAAASSISSISAVSGGNITNDGGASGGVTNRGVCWSTEPNPDVSDWKTSLGSGSNSFSSNITSLSPITTYYVRAYAVNSYGIGYGEQISFTTPADIPTLVTNVITNITQNSATSGGDITKDGGAEVTARGVCWSTNHNPTISNSYTTDGNGIGTFSSNITGLSGNTTYYVRAYATNSAGTAYGEEREFTTFGSLPTLSTTSISQITHNSAQSGGNITHQGGSAVTARGVCWSLNQNPTISDSKTSNGDGIGTYTSNLTGLESGKTYYVRAYATNSQGTAYGSQISLKTHNKHDIALAAGWNMISTFMDPTNSSLELIYSDIEESTVIVKNNFGQIYYPEFEINDIGDWDVTQGYQVYMSQADTITISGIKIVPETTEIILAAGWNLLAYLRDNPMDIEIALAPLVADAKLVIVKDNIGNIFYPAFEINNIGAMFPGQGYQIYMIEGETLIYPENFRSEAVKIGEQVWLKSNLDVVNYRNGDPIRHAASDEEWIDAGDKSEGVWCYYNNDPANGAIYGKLYNWFAVKDPRGLAPEGWHVPNDVEWKILEIHLELSWQEAFQLGWRGTTVGAKLAGFNDLWVNGELRNHSEFGKSGFSGSPAGYRNSYGDFNKIGYETLWWSASAYSEIEALYRNISSYFPRVSRYSNDMKQGFSVRCVKDVVQEIETITLGTQIWTKKNLDVANYRNGDSIRHATSHEAWEDAAFKGEGAWCYNAHDTANGPINGKLYNWYAVNDSRGLAPEGWHVPSDEEWKILEMHLGMSQQEADNVEWRGSTEGTKLAGYYNLWGGGDLKDHFEFGKSGFSGSPAGIKHVGLDAFTSIGFFAIWWTATEYNSNLAIYRSLYITEIKVDRNYNGKSQGYSVRCVRD